MHIVSITTDFGLQDYYVAELKAHIYQRSPEAQIVDVSHSIDSHDIVQAAHFVENVFYWTLRNESENLKVQLSTLFVCYWSRTVTVLVSDIVGFQSWDG